MPEGRMQTPNFQGRTRVHFRKPAGFTAWLALASGVYGKIHEPARQQDSGYKVRLDHFYLLTFAVFFYTN